MVLLVEVRNIFCAVPVLSAKFYWTVNAWPIGFHAVNHMFACEPILPLGTFFSPSLNLTALQPHPEFHLFLS